MASQIELGSIPDNFVFWKKKKKSSLRGDKKGQHKRREKEEGPIHQRHLTKPQRNPIILYLHQIELYNVIFLAWKTSV